jgi:TPP-dependent pyruvate/acetoin dehydrogenase alpha subunit
MKTKLSPDDLINFENDIAEYFNQGLIRAPIHLYAGNEQQIVKIFKKISPSDWVLCSWRSHYQCLLKGVPPDQLKSDILNGRSISLCYKEQRIFSSAIVTGVLPIAVGIACDIQRKKGKNKVFCFMGDMTSESGMAHECIKYSINHALPIHFVIEDNGKSVCTDTRKTWGSSKLSYENFDDEYVSWYRYDLEKYPHAGSGKRIQF